MVTYSLSCMLVADPEDVSLKTSSKTSKFAEIWRWKTNNSFHNASKGPSVMNVSYDLNVEPVTAASQCGEYSVLHSAHQAFVNWRLKTLNNKVSSQTMAGVGDENSYSVDRIKEHHIKSAVKLTHSTDHLVDIVNSIMK